MKTWTKSAGLTLAAVMTLGTVLAGCGGSGGSEGKTTDGSPAASASSSEASKAPNAEKVKLTVWIWDQAMKALSVNMDDFKKEYPNIEIEFQTMKTGDVYQKYLVAANSMDTTPDIVALETSNLAQMVNINSLLDITEKVKPYKDKFNAYKWADAEKDGKLYAMPWDSGPVTMFYRKDLFEKAGLPTDPKDVAAKLATFKDYADAGKALKDKGIFLYSDSKTKSNNRIFETMIWQRGFWYFDKDGKVTLDSPEVIEIAKYNADMMNAGYVFDAEPWADAWLNSLKDGKVATIIGASWHDGLLPSWIAPDGKGLWAVAPMPKWSVDDKFGSANDGGSNLAINKNSKHPEEAWKFIEFMLGKESSQLKMLDKEGFFPSLESTYSDAAYQKPVEYFGGQPVRSLFVDAVKQVAPIAYTKDFPTANQMTTDAFSKIYLKKTPVEEVLKSTADELRKKTKRQ